MTQLFIHVVNSEYASRDEGADYALPEAALSQGVTSAVAIVTDEIAKGLPSAAVEVAIEREDGTPVLRSVVTLSVARLLVVPPPQ